MKFAIPLFVLVVGSAQPIHAAESEQFRYKRLIETAVESEGIGVIALDRDVFRNTREEFPDLRLMRNGEGKPEQVPFVIERIPDTRPAKSASLLKTKVVSFDQLENGDVRIRVKLAKDQRSAGRIEVQTPLRNFEKSVSVFGVDASQKEIPLVTDKLIFDYESFLDFRRTGILLPENAFREFVIRLSKATDRQRSAVKELTRTAGTESGVTVKTTESVETRHFRIDRLAFYAPGIPLEKNLSVRAEDLDITGIIENEEEKRTEVVFDGEMLPIDSLIFRTNDRNFKRRVELQIPVDDLDDQWRTIHSGTLFRYSLADFEEENLTLSFPEQRSPAYRLLIHNRDNSPVSLESVVGIGEIFELRFITEPEADYALYFGGNELIGRPDYDVAAITAAVRQKVSRLPLELGQIAENPDYRPAQVKGPGMNQPWILWIAIAVVVAGLVMVLFKTAKQIDQKTI